jgi:uncharacterized protein YjdB
MIIAFTMLVSLMPTAALHAYASQKRGMNDQVENNEDTVSSKVYTVSNQVYDPDGNLFLGKLQLMEEKKVVVADEVINKLKEYYDSQSKLDYDVVMAYRQLGEDTSSMVSKLNKAYNTTNYTNCIKGIMGAIAVDENPRDFEKANGQKADFVGSLASFQNQNGSFVSSLPYHIECVIALDMANGSYDQQGAVKYILDNLRDDGENKYVAGSYVKDKLKNTARAMIALSKHREIAGVNEAIEKCVNYIKACQKDHVGFDKYRPDIQAIANVIQGLLAVGKDPVSSEFSKGQDNLYTELLKGKLDNGTFKEVAGNGGYFNKYATMAAFRALADLKIGKSMYEALRVQVGEVPSKIILESKADEILKGKTLKLQYKVVDDQDRIVPGQRIVWTSSDEGIATVNDGLVAGIKAGDVTITASIENGSITQTIAIKVSERKPTTIKLYLNKKEVKDQISIKKDENIHITGKVLDQGNEEINDVSITWEVVAGQEYITLDHGEITGKAVGTAKVKAKCQEAEAIFHIEVVAMSGIFKNTLDEVKPYYNNKASYNYIEALGLRHAGEDEASIQQKIRIETNLSSAEKYAKNIITLIAAGLDPRDYNGHDYVQELVDKQGKSGYFNIGYSSSDPENVILPVIALDMAGAEYNVAKAMDILEQKSRMLGSGKCIPKSNDYGVIEITALAMIAMSKHMDEDGINDLVDAYIRYFKYKQTDNGAFTAKDMYYRDKENCKATAAVVQGLIAIGQDPLGTEWIKNDKTIFDALISFRKDTGFKETKTAYGVDQEATALGFAALADLVRNKSMYKEIKVELGTIPHSIEIIGDQDFVKEGQKLKLKAKVLDENNKLVVGKKIKWTSSATNKAVVDEAGWVTGQAIDADTTVQITAKVDKTEITATKAIAVKARVPHTMEITLPLGKKKELKEGTTLKLSKKVLEEDGEEIKEEEVIWSSSDTNIATINQTGLVTAKDVAEDKTITIKAIVKNKPSVKKEISLKIIAVIPKKMKIFIGEKEAQKAILEVGQNLSLMAKAYEEDDTWMKGQAIEWTSSDENIASIDQAGLITAKPVDREKNITITAKTKGFELSKTFDLKVIPVQTDEQKAQRVIEELKLYYEKDTKYDCLEALALKRAGVDTSSIQAKLDLPDVNFIKGSSGKESDQYAKAIMALLSAGLDPKAYQGHDYVSFLTTSQTEEGYFDARGYRWSSDDEADCIAYSMIALDMVGASYNENKAIDALKNKFKISGNKAYVKRSSWSDTPDLEKTALAVIALSNHKDINGVDELINKVKAYLKEEYNGWDEDTNCQEIGQTIQAITAIGENPLSQEYIKTDEAGNKTTMLDALLKLKEESGFKGGGGSLSKEEATAFAFAALTDIKTGKSMYKPIKTQGAPTKVVIHAENDQKELKVGHTLSLTAKAFDKDDNFISDQEFVWSVDQPAIAAINEKTGEFTAIGAGTVVITAMLKDNNAVKNTMSIKVIPHVPNTVQVTVDQNIDRIETGKKVKINAKVLDTDGEVIQKPSITWSIEPTGFATIDENNILTGLKAGRITIKAIIKKEASNVEGSIALEITQGKIKEEKLNDGINFSKEYLVTKDEYECIHSMALRSIHVDVDHIASKLNIYNMDNLNCQGRNTINLIAACENPRDYKGKNYIDKIINAQPKFYNHTTAEYVAKAIIALDMAQEKYDETAAITALINKLKNNSGKVYAITEDDDEEKEDIQGTQWVLIALSKHQKVAGVVDAIKGIKKYLKEKQDENAFIESCMNTSLTIQGIIAIGEDPLSGEWVKYDSYGNAITLLDALLKCKGTKGFKYDHSEGIGGYDHTAYALCALADLKNNTSMYHEIKYVKAGAPARIEITNQEPIEVIAGDTVQIKTTIYDQDNHIVKNQSLTWESSDSQKGTVNNGLVKTLKEGTIKIKVYLKNNKDIYDEISIKINSGISEEVLKGRLKNEIQFLKDVYKDYKQYEFVAAPGAVLLGIDKENVKEHVITTSHPTTTMHYIKMIIALVGAGKNPREHEIKKGSKQYKNYVDIVRAHQIKDGPNKGQFIISKYSDPNNIEALGYTIIALDMVDAEYDEESAIKALIKLIDIEDKKKNTSMYKEVKSEAVALTAFAQHKDIEGVSERIDHLLKYLESKRNQDGGFNEDEGKINSPIVTGAVVQALVANGINPLYSTKWFKGQKTVLDSIIKSKYISKLRKGYSQYEGGQLSYDALNYTCAAFADMYTNESMFKRLAIKYDGSASVGEIAKINILKPEKNKLLMGQTLKLQVSAFDDKNSLIENPVVLWKSSDDTIASVKDGLVQGIKSGKVKIIAYVKDKDIESAIDLSVEDLEVKNIKIQCNKDKIRVGDIIELEAKAFDKIDKPIEGKAFIWEVDDTAIAKKYEKEGKVYLEGMGKGQILLIAKLKDHPDIKHEMTINVIDKKSAKVKVRVEGSKNNIIPETELEVDNFDMGIYGDGSCIVKENPTVMNALIAALQKNGIDCTDKEKFDAGNKLGLLDKINGLKNFGAGANSGWKYHVNDKYVSDFMNNVQIHDGNEICVYYVEDYKKNTYTYFDQKEVIIKPNESFTLQLKGRSKNDVDTNINIKEANIVYKESNEKTFKNYKDVLTDAEGKATLKFEKEGEYIISATRMNKDLNVVDISRPYCKVKVTNNPFSDLFEINVLNDDFSNGEEARLKIRIRNKLEKLQNMVCKIVLCDENNKVLKASSIEKALEANEETLASPGFAIPDDGVYTIKVFLSDKEEIDVFKPVKSITME